jgi:hypothetical protein
MSHLERRTLETVRGRDSCAPVKWPLANPETRPPGKSQPARSDERLQACCALSMFCAPHPSKKPGSHN